MVKELKITALATDPIYIGTGGYTIGRVDNTIVRDPVTRLPKIPGSSLAGTWRYYMALELNNYIKPELRNFKDRKTIINGDGTKSDKLKQILISENSTPSWIKDFDNNLFHRIQCAGQDEVPNLELSSYGYDGESGKTGHCGYCIVCKSFGFSKKTLSWQGMLSFSDFEILLFPVYTRLGTRWITTKEKLEDFINDKQTKIKLKGTNEQEITRLEKTLIFTKEKDCNENSLNLGWLNLDVKGCWTFENNENDFEKVIKKHNIDINDIIIVHEDIFSQIVNSNLEVRTSVSIDPLTGAAKEGALFTSEAIPRGTVFSGCIRIFEKDAFAGWEQKIGELPTYDLIKQALIDSKKYYESLGIGGMTTRGFGRLKIELQNSECQQTDASIQQNQPN